MMSFVEYKIILYKIVFFSCKFENSKIYVNILKERKINRKKWQKV